MDDVDSLQGWFSTNGGRVGRKQLSAPYGAKLRQKACAALKAPWIMLLHVKGNKIVYQRLWKIKRNNA